MNLDTYNKLRKVAGIKDYIQDVWKGLTTTLPNATEPIALAKRWGRSYKPFGGSSKDYKVLEGSKYKYGQFTLPAVNETIPTELLNKVKTFQASRTNNQANNVKLTAINNNRTQPTAPRFINDLARQISVAENANSINIPVNDDGSFNLSGDSWLHPSMGIRTGIKQDKFSSAVGMSQTTGPTYLQWAVDGDMPATWWISNPKKIREFYNLALDMRPDANKRLKAQAGVNSIGKAIEQWQAKYGPDSVGPLARYILGIHKENGVKHGENANLPIQFYRDHYAAMQAILKRRANVVRKRFPGISDRELAERLALSWKHGTSPREKTDNYLYKRYNRESDYLRLFRAAGNRLWGK